MKRILILTLCAALLLCLTACGGGSVLPPSGLPTQPASAAASSEPVGEAPLPAPDFPEQRFSFIKDCPYIGVEDGELVILSAGGSVHYGENMPMLSEKGISTDGSTARPSFYHDNAYSYYYFADGALQPVAEWGFYHACSRDGRTAIVRPDGTENVSVIYRDGEITERLDAGGTDYLMSPDGSAATFLVYPDGNGLESVAMLWQAGKGLTELGKDLYPVAVADNAEYLYLRVRGASGPLRVQRGADRDTARPVQPKWVDSLVIFNEDYSEVLAAGERCAYWSVQGREAVEVPKDAVHIVLPDKTAGDPLGESWSGDRCYGISTFQDAIYIDYATEHWTLNRLHMAADGSVKSEALSDVLDWDDVKLSADGSGVAWRSGKSIWWRHVDPADRKLGNEPVPVCEGFDSPNGLAISADGRTVYYVGETGLQAWRDGETEQIAARGEYGYFDPVGNAIFYVKDNVLWGWNGGASRCLSEELPWVRVIDSTNDFILFCSANYTLFKCGDDLTVVPIG